MTTKTTIAAITILLLILPIINAIPINSSPTIDNNINITIRDSTKINNTVIIEPLEIEKYPKIKNFLNNLSDCDWCIACGSYAHYTRIEAEKQNISIHEITLTTDISRFGVSDGHRINFFYADNGHKVYIDNVVNGHYILELNELIPYHKTRFGLNVERIGFKNIKLSKI